jgi:hypothetical protein
LKPIIFAIAIMRMSWRLNNAINHHTEGKL